MRWRNRFMAIVEAQDLAGGLPDSSHQILTTNPIHFGVQISERRLGSPWRATDGSAAAVSRFTLRRWYLWIVTPRSRQQFARIDNAYDEALETLTTQKAVRSRRGRGRSRFASGTIPAPLPLADSAKLENASADAVVHARRSTTSLREPAGARSA